MEQAALSSQRSTPLLIIASSYVQTYEMFYFGGSSILNRFVLYVRLEAGCVAVWNYGDHLLLQ